MAQDYSAYNIQDLLDELFGKALHIGVAEWPEIPAEVVIILEILEREPVFDRLAYDIDRVKRQVKAGEFDDIEELYHALQDEYDVA